MFLNFLSVQEIMAALRLIIARASPSTAEKSLRSIVVLANVYWKKISKLLETDEQNQSDTIHEFFGCKQPRENIIFRPHDILQFLAQFCIQNINERRQMKMKKNGGKG